MAKILCKDELDQAQLHSIEPLNACRLIPLNKNPGVRPIGIGEVLRRIIGKAVMKVFKDDVQTAAGPSQLCAGQQAGCEAAIHSVVDNFNEDIDCEGVLQIDASNAFNSLNRKIFMHNIKIICPYLSTYVNNTYAKPARLFILGGKELLSEEGTTQGDPIAMAVYALGILPLLTTLKLAVQNKNNNLLQVSFADDISGSGKLEVIKLWWDEIVTHGPTIGYFANGGKSWLIVKDDYVKEAQEIFSQTSIKITSEGRRHLGACIGKETFKESYVNEKVETWVKEVKNLATIAKSEPHCALAAFTHGLKNKYVYFMRTIPNIEKYLGPLENAIRNDLIPEILEGHSCNDTERKLLALSPKFGGLGLINLLDISCSEFDNSRKITYDLVTAIKEQRNIYDEDKRKINEIKNKIKTEKSKKSKEVLDEIKNEINDNFRTKLLESSMEQGAYNWLTALPLQQYHYYLDKRTFWDSIRLRYNLPLSRLPEKCACSNSFDIEHALNCKKGGFITNRHNVIRDLTANMLNQVTHDVELEPVLEPKTGEQLHKSAISTENARVDIAARSVWIKGQRAFFDVRVFNPLARTYRELPLPKIYERNEKEKKRNYNERVLQIEHGSFTPLVFSSLGGMGRECSTFYSKLAELISEKQSIDKSQVITSIRTSISFALLKSTNMCIRGSRSLSRYKCSFESTNCELMNNDSKCEKAEIV